MTKRPVKKITTIKFILLLVATSLLLSACNHHSEKTAQQPPTAIMPGDTCAVCGMYITHYPGPRGEAYIQGMKTPLKFGSTRDFFAYVLQPEHKALLQTLYVQDVATINWQHPKDHWIDARKAWYVPESSLPGAMGPTLASFLHRKDAIAFSHRYGGEILGFNDVTIQLISKLSMHSMPMKLRHTQ